jgi:hypothetical protein
MLSKKQFRIPGPAQRYDSIDDEILTDIEFVNKRRFASLYRCERYKHKRHTIEILIPKLEYETKTPFIKTADHMRFLLSLYPEKRDLTSLNRIIIKPRHIEASRIELMALYLRKKKTLVHYLYVPHSYDITASVSAAYNEFIPYDSERMINRFDKPSGISDMMVPPLLYIISMLGSSGNEIDKFFLRCHDFEYNMVLTELDEISDFYRRNGY